MANLLQSSQTQATTAPDYYTKYLSDIASQGANAATGAQYIGAQPLQQQAFENVGTASTAYQPTLEQAGQTLTSAAGTASPLASATPYLTKALNDPSQMAQGYMSPYIKSVIDNLSDIGQRNIQQNIAPSATSAAVGSGQYGSQRGAQVLSQATANAERDLANQIAQTLNTGYNTALQTAQQQNQLAGQLGSTAANAESAAQQNLTQAGKAQSDLAAQNQALGLAGVNALATLGGQQQTIAQNQQLFPLTNLATLSGLLRGYNVPTTTTTTAQGSPLSGLATLGALSQTPAASNLASGVSNLYNKYFGNNTVNTGLGNNSPTSSGTTDYSGSDTGKGVPYQTVYDSSGAPIGSYDAGGNFVKSIDSTNDALTGSLNGIDFIAKTQ
jgi:hypothetical protein